MTPTELRDLCGDGTGLITLTIPREPNESGIRLMPNGPRGEIACVWAEGKTVARFRADAVLAWLDRMEGESNE